MEPGESGELEFRVVNRYTLDMTAIIIEVEIFKAANEDESKDISDVKHPPTLTAVDHASPGDGTTKVTYSIATLVGHESPTPADVHTTIKFKIRSHEDTYEATYFIRTMISFTYPLDENGTFNSTEYVMRSKGHFTNEKWEQAGDAADDSNGATYGNINLDVLQVSGITPDTSFGVRSDFPQWPKYVFLSAAILFAGAGAFFIAMENYGKFPEVKKWMDEKLSRGK